MPLQLPAPRTTWLERYAAAWFGLGVAVLFALGIGLALVLTLGREWLETRLNLTFPTPLSPTAWGLLALVPMLVILLYFLKLKRRPQTVPSTFLWKKSVEDLHVNSLFQWLKRNALLLLQLLGLLGLGYALADPTYNSEAKGRNFIFLLDNSASMAATDVKPSRFAEAKRRLHQRIDALDGTDQAMLIAFNSEASIVQSFTNRRSDLHLAVDRVQLTQRTTRLQPALALAEGQANPRRSAEEGAIELPTEGQMARSMGQVEGMTAQVVILTDGRFPDVTDFTAGRLKLRLDIIGERGNNVGIGWMNLRRDELRPDQYDLAVRVLNFTDQPLNQRVQLLLEVFGSGERLDRQAKAVDLQPMTMQRAAGGEERGVKETLLPGSTVPEPIVTFSFADPGNGYVRVTLRDLGTGGPWQDDFGLDDSAWLAISPIRRARVLRIGPMNDILTAFLQASQKSRRALVTELPATDFVNHETYRQAVNSERFDLVIFDRVAPPRVEDMPEANTFFLGQAPPWKDGKWEDLPELSDLFIKEFRTAHPLLRGIETLQGMNIRSAKALPASALPRRATALMETQLEPVMWALGRERFTDLVMTFPLVTMEGNALTWNTNWPKQPAGTLPLFLDNVITQLGRYSEYEESFRPGIPITLRPDVDVKSVTVKLTDPPGAAVTLLRTPGRELIYNAPETAGIYEVSWGEPQPYRFAVNLFDAAESSIQPRKDVQIGVEEVATEKETLRKRRQVWPWLALAALAVLGIEWWLYQRRIFV